MLIVDVVGLALLVLSVPIGTALSAAAEVYILIDPLLGPEVIFRAFFKFINRYSLMAIPLAVHAHGGRGSGQAPTLRRNGRPGDVRKRLLSIDGVSSFRASRFDSSAAQSDKELGW